jgi:hypothetical protein
MRFHLKYVDRSPSSKFPTNQVCCTKYQIVQCCEANALQWYSAVTAGTKGSNDDFPHLILTHLPSISCCIIASSQLVDYLVLGTQMRSVPPMLPTRQGDLVSTTLSVRVLYPGSAHELSGKEWNHSFQVKFSRIKLSL